jgi:hypothetical protein
MRTVLAAIALMLASSVLADDAARLAGTWNIVSVA